MYTIQWFKEKFQAIPEEKWEVFRLIAPNDAHCALGHCGVVYDTKSSNYIGTKESEALIDIFKETLPDMSVPDKNPFVAVLGVNDGFYPTFNGNQLGATPKERILKVLEMAEELENQELMKANIEFVNSELTAELV